MSKGEKAKSAPGYDASTKVEGLESDTTGRTAGKLAADASLKVALERRRVMKATTSSIRQAGSSRKNPKRPS